MVINLEKDILNSNMTQLFLQKKITVIYQVMAFAMLNLTTWTM